jgi:branched-subunit amino acid transport protein
VLTVERLSTPVRLLLAYLVVGTVAALLAPGVLAQVLGALTVVGIVGSLALAGADTVRWLSRR